jgi:Holliday junction resolvasome RuvABC endonuclease subunit
MSVHGIDPGLANIGRASISQYGGKPESEHFIPPGTGVQRLVAIYRWAAALPVCHLVVVENFAFDRANQAHQIGQARGALELGLHCRGQDVIFLSPSELKQWLSGKGNLPKPLMPMRVLAHWGFEAQSEHEAAAYGLMKFGEALLLVQGGIGIGTVKSALDLTEYQVGVLSGFLDREAAEEVKAQAERGRAERRMARRRKVGAR